jgi:hypothetical protein
MYYRYLKRLHFNQRNTNTKKKNPLCLMLRRLPSSLITSGEEESAIFSLLPKHQCVSNGNSQRHSRFSNLFTVLSTLPRPANGRRAANYAKLWTASTAVGLMFSRYTFEVLGSLFLQKKPFFDEPYKVPNPDKISKVNEKN